MSVLVDERRDKREQSGFRSNFFVAVGFPVL